MSDAASDERPGQGVSGLRAQAVTVAYAGVDVVHDAALVLRSGQVTALVGPNGSGKSTLLRAVARLHRPRHGTVTLGAHPSDQPDAAIHAAKATGVDGFALSLRDFSRHVAFLTQGRPTPGGLSVRELVEFGRYPHRGRWGRPDPRGATAVEQAMLLTGVAEFAGRGVDQLSGGQLQRVWLASCLAQETGVLLLDEPTNHLDLRYQVELLDLIRDLADEQRIGIGVVLHDLDQAGAIADRMTLLSEGRIVADGAPRDVLEASRLSEVYGIRIDVDLDPLSGRVRTRAIGRHHHRTERRLPAL